MSSSEKNVTEKTTPPLSREEQLSLWKLKKANKTKKELDSSSKPQWRRNSYSDTANVKKNDIESTSSTSYVKRPRGSHNRIDSSRRNTFSHNVVTSKLFAPTAASTAREISTTNLYSHSSPESGMKKSSSISEKTKKRNENRNSILVEQRRGDRGLRIPLSSIGSAGSNAPKSLRRNEIECKKRNPRKNMNVKSVAKKVSGDNLDESSSIKPWRAKENQTLVDEKCGCAVDKINPADERCRQMDETSSMENVREERENISSLSNLMDHSSRHKMDQRSSQQVCKNTNHNTDRTTPTSSSQFKKKARLKSPDINITTTTSFFTSVRSPTIKIVTSPQLLTETSRVLIKSRPLTPKSSPSYSPVIAAGLPCQNMGEKKREGVGKQLFFFPEKESCDVGSTESELQISDLYEESASFENTDKTNPNVALVGTIASSLVSVTDKDVGDEYLNANLNISNTSLDVEQPFSKAGDNSSRKDIKRREATNLYFDRDFRRDCTYGGSADSKINNHTYRSCDRCHSLETDKTSSDSTPIEDTNETQEKSSAVAVKTSNQLCETRSIQTVVHHQVDNKSTLKKAELSLREITACKPLTVETNQRQSTNPASDSSKRIDNGIEFNVNKSTRSARHNCDFTNEWPKDRKLKDKMARDEIQKAMENKDFDSFVRICHMYREEFAASRFYIGTLIMEKEDLQQRMDQLSNAYEEKMVQHRQHTSEIIELRQKNRVNASKISRLEQENKELQAEMTTSITTLQNQMMQLMTLKEMDGKNT